MTVVVGVVLCSPPVVSSYSSTVILSNYGEAQIYYDMDNIRQTVIDSITEKTSVSLVKSQTSVDFTPDTCNTTCVGGQDCPSRPGAGCGIGILQPFVYLQNATEVGDCGGGISWLYTISHEGEQNSTSIIFCMNENTPISVVVEQNNEPYYVALFFDFVAGVPDPSVFEIPDYCPCISNTSSLIANEVKRNEEIIPRDVEDNKFLSFFNFFHKLA
eukprot:TRINITY_DN939_c0_g1_i1.p1 TRINITY_DN939_c0_g1~~TRINITY_DN939_c0_g1_i1.p1  ORF type:complete len:237 (-),score=51.13 TRINITY_DN939_c0_g1_i1:83-727(-)